MHVFFVLLFCARAGRPASAAVFLAGVTLFSGSLYVYSATGEKTAARVAPVGGLCLIVAWVMLALRR